MTDLLGGKPLGTGANSAGGGMIQFGWCGCEKVNCGYGWIGYTYCGYWYYPLGIGIGY